MKTQFTGEVCSYIISNQSIIEYDLIPFDCTIYFPNLLQGLSGIFYNIEQKFTVEP